MTIEEAVEREDVQSAILCHAQLSMKVADVLSKELERSSLRLLALFGRKDGGSAEEIENLRQAVLTAVSHLQSDFSLPTDHDLVKFLLRSVGKESNTY